MLITIIAGARPNFIKIAPIIQAIQKAKNWGNAIDFRLVHTGQHYDPKMSDTFFKELNIPNPHVNLGGGGGSQAEQTAAIMVAFEKDLISHPSGLVLVVGDVTSTLACSIVAKKLCTPVAHVEAGIRSFDISMPEEINRLVTDSITDYFFTTSEYANENLRNAGIPESKIYFVGNVMIDSLLANQHRFTPPSFWEDKRLSNGQYLVMTLHRPSNVDNGLKLTEIIHEIIEHSNGLPIIFPIHPRTAKIFKDSNISAGNLHLIEPLGYLEFNYLVKHCKAVITDSGGITEETTVLGIPCITLRDSTERPETVVIGTNELIGSNPLAIQHALKKLFDGKWKKGRIPEKWDGKTSERIVQSLVECNNLSLN